MTVKTIEVRSNEKVCLNCAHYDPYYRKNYGNVHCWFPVSVGYCEKKEDLCGAMQKSCKEFENRKESSRC